MSDTYVAQQTIGDILIVDDTLPNLEILMTMLTEQGYEVRPARNGALALQFARATPPDLILLDILMPDLDGYEVCRRLKADSVTQEIPVIFLSALSDTFDKVKAFAVGAVDYITKPFHQEEVLARVATHLKIRQQQMALASQNQTLRDLNAALQREIAERQRVEAELEKANQELQRLAMIDGLTQVANRRQFDDYLQREWKRQAREETPLSLILCDIDYFKRYNDTYGHVAGDECLKQIARALGQAARRPGDLVARYGGEEFTVILPNTDAEGAMTVARTIQKEIRELRIPHEQSSVSRYVTLSIGVFSITPRLDYPPEFLVNAADQALYQVKEQGRNTAILATLKFPEEESGKQSAEKQ